MSFFIERLDGRPVNMTLIQTVYVDPEDKTDVIWFMRNGEIYREDLATEEEAQKRFKDIKGLLLGTTIAELEDRIVEQQNTIVEQAKTIEDTSSVVHELTIDTIEINGEEAQ